MASTEGSKSRTPDLSAWRRHGVAIFVAGFIAATLIVAWLAFGPLGRSMTALITAGTAHPHPLWPVSLFSLLFLAAALAYASKGSALPDLVGALAPRRARAMTAAIIAAGIALSLLSVWLLRAFANSGDEYDYLFEAETFLSGHLWNPLLPGHEFFSFTHIFEKDGKWVSQYPPGWPLLLAGLAKLAIPFWLATPLCGGLLLIVLAKFARDEEDPATAVIAVALTALTAFFAFNAGSYFSHVPAALFGVLFCTIGSRFIARPSWSSAIGAGAALGAVGLIRPYNVVFFLIPYAVEVLWRARRGHWVRFVGFAIGGLPFLAVMLGYDKAITGNALLPVTNWGYPLLKMGFHSADELGRPSTLVDTAGMAAIRLGELVEWTSPLLLLAAAPAFVWKAWSFRLRFYDLVFPAAIVAYLFFPALGGNSYGPRYYLEAYPLLTLTIAAFAVRCMADPRRPRWRTATLLLLAGHLAVCAIGFVSLAIFERRTVDERRDVYTQVERAALHNAVVVLHSKTGTISPMDQRDLVRNGLDRSADVLYALDLPGRTDELRALLPSRQFYVYERPPNDPVGTLRLLP
jgi:hypothetical protein